MSSCAWTDKFGYDFDAIPDEQFNLLLVHSDSCDYHNRLLSEYEESLIPVMRLALPEQVFHCRPRSKSVFLRAFYSLKRRYRNFVINRGAPIRISLTSAVISVLLMITMITSIAATFLYLDRKSGGHYSTTPSPSSDTVERVTSTKRPQSLAQPDTTSIASNQLPSSLPPQKEHPSENRGPAIIVWGELPPQSTEPAAAQEEAKDSAPDPGKTTSTQERIVFNGPLYTTAKFKLNNLTGDELKTATCRVVSKTNSQVFSHPVTPDKDGYCWAQLQNPGVYVLTIQASGFRTFEDEIITSPGSVNLNQFYRLTPIGEGSSEPSSADKEDAELERPVLSSKQ